MTSRKKRLKKGIESLKKQVEIHEKKLKEAVDKDYIELVEYYEKEIKAKKRDIEKKERLLKR